MRIETHAKDRDWHKLTEAAVHNGKKIILKGKGNLW